MNYFKFLVSILLLILITDCSSNRYDIIAKAINIIPVPVEAETGTGKFVINHKTIILVEPDNDSVLSIAKQFSQKFQTASGISLTIEGHNVHKQKRNSILFLIDQIDSLPGKEGYSLVVSSRDVQIRAPYCAGLFYGMQTLKQLMPVEIESKNIVSGIRWNLPEIKIRDYPRYSWRGLHLDVSRHMSSIGFIKEYLDNMAMHKLNTFHWHLTDDQGWRIEIKKYPKLTEVGAWREETEIGFRGSGKFDGKRYGGYYTQDEIKEIVNYAKDRFITVIPEIEMPGHSTAAIASYPWLGATNKEIQVKTTWGISPNIFNVKDSTFIFLEDVLKEVMLLFPSKYIHIGGDEALKDQWKISRDIQEKINELGLKNEHELQSWFIQRIEKFVNSRGRMIIGWDEIMEGGLAPNAAVMSWRGEQGGIAAAKSKHNVVMSPMNYLYFNIYQGDPQFEPREVNIGLVTLEKAYRYDPSPGDLSSEEQNYVKGPHGCMWTPFIPNEAMIEYHLYPRLSALSEIAWSPTERKDWNDFKRRLPAQLDRYELLDINYSRSIYYVTYQLDTISDNSTYKITFNNQFELDGMRYTLDADDPDESSALYIDPLEVEKGTIIKAGLFQDGKLLGKITQIII